MKENDNLSTNDGIESARRRAYALRSRIKELGHEISISHSYEIMATARGFRNWPTMKAGLSGSSGDGLVIAATTSTDSVHRSGEPADVPLRISREKCADHIEVVGDSKDFHADTILGILRGGIAEGWGAILLNTTGDPERSIKLKQIASEYGRGKDFRFVDLNRLPADVALGLPKFDGRTSGLLDGDGSYDTSWKFHQTLALDSALGGLIWLRDQGKIVLDRESITRHVGLLGMIELLDMTRHMPPWLIRHRLRLALDSIPQGMRHDAGFRQSMESISLHDKMMAGIADMIYNAGDMPSGTYSFPGRRPLLLDAVRAGNIVAIDIPKIGQWNDLGCELARRVFDDVVESLKAESADHGLRPTVAAFTDADDGIRATEAFDLKLRAATQAGGCLVLGSDRNLPFPSLKKATSIHCEWGEITSDDKAWDAEIGDEAVRDVLAGRDALRVRHSEEEGVTA